MAVRVSCFRPAMRKSTLHLGLTLGLALALTFHSQASAKLKACNRGDIKPTVSGVTLNAIARSIEADHPPWRIDRRKLLSVGSKIDPRQKIAGVPHALTKALPQYARYEYFLTKRYIVIVHPLNRRIAYLLPFCPLPHS
ncbi:hypothetical protein [Methyloferula stellata]|uniref:hypothetical protein n=1 Tax=Methyloferula stellata TaxID=876270 RepID=UPI001268CC7E|nr:hypothetical protein [Methyloferula stellata]